MNRLAERGLLTRSKRGNAYVYEPKISESEYVSRAISQTLAVASSDARPAALAQLIGRLHCSTAPRSSSVSAWRWRTKLGISMQHLRVRARETL